jgi:hypothetical protein
MLQEKVTPGAVCQFINVLTSPFNMSTNYRLNLLTLSRMSRSLFFVMSSPESTIRREVMKPVPETRRLRSLTTSTASQIPLTLTTLIFQLTQTSRTLQTSKLRLNQITTKTWSTSKTLKQRLNPTTSKQRLNSKTTKQRRTPMSSRTRTANKSRSENRFSSSRPPAFTRTKAATTSSSRRRPPPTTTLIRSRATLTDTSLARDRLSNTLEKNNTFSTSMIQNLLSKIISFFIFVSFKHNCCS